ncbi:hypothetical protein EDB84DRAFT_700001 [Lactarius hengduanensis]|nr:hypothetical protein EDB84DRAFT_700001 [Lactarius hengduanensis]
MLSVLVAARGTGRGAEDRATYEEVSFTQCSVESRVSVDRDRPLCFAMSPEMPIIHASMFQLVKWAPTKFDIPIILPGGDEVLTFDKRHLGRDLQPSQTGLPDDAQW